MRCSLATKVSKILNCYAGNTLLNCLGHFAAKVHHEGQVINLAEFSFFTPSLKLNCPPPHPDPDRLSDNDERFQRNHGGSSHVETF